MQFNYTACFYEHWLMIFVSGSWEGLRYGYRRQGKRWVRSRQEEANTPSAPEGNSHMIESLANSMYIVQLHSNRKQLGRFLRLAIFELAF